MLMQYQRLENSSQNRTKPIQQEKKTYYKVSSLIGTSKETGWMSIHLVLESSGGAILHLSTQSLPELICKRQKHFKLSQPSNFVRGQSNSLTFG